MPNALDAGESDAGSGKNEEHLDEADEGGLRGLRGAKMSRGQFAVSKLCLRRQVFADAPPTAEPAERARNPQ